MCRNYTLRYAVRLAGLILAVAIVAGTSSAQTGLEWRRIGNIAVDASLASLASGPVARVWFAADGSRLFVQTESGRVLASEDFENWKEVAQDEITPPVPAGVAAPGMSRPEAGARIVRAGGRAGLVYALGRAVYKSEDDGSNWSNLTEYRGQSILGGGLTDLTVSPHDPDEIVVANKYGVWRSVDGGLSWSGMNESLPALPARRLLRLPSGGDGTRLLLDGLGEVEWAPGEKSGWRPVFGNELALELALRQALSGSLGARILSVATAGDYVYAGGSGGVLWTSPDGGRTWRLFSEPSAGPVVRIFADDRLPGTALAAVGKGTGQGRGAHVLRTTNGGIFWDDLTSNLPDVAAHAVTADPESGAVYVATDAGTFFAIADLAAAGPAPTWVSLAGNLPTVPAYDVRLDAGGNQLYVVLEGEGVLAATAPHRFLAPRVVNAADWSAEAAAPGALLSVLGYRVQTAKAGSLDVPVLAASDAESQIQVPFEATGSSLSLALTAAGVDLPGRFTVGLPLQPVAPAIFVDRDGTPMLIDADSGVLLDAMKPAQSNSRLQILATGLGRVRPDWPTGLPAPLENPPAVAASIRVYLDRRPVEVSRATLAPGYVGFYLVEVRVPEIVNTGPAELYIEAEGQQSNRVRLYVEP